jgi:hypothetical protein
VESLFPTLAVVNLMMPWSAIVSKASLPLFLGQEQAEV